MDNLDGMPVLLVPHAPYVKVTMYFLPLYNGVHSIPNRTFSDGSVSECLLSGFIQEIHSGQLYIKTFCYCYITLF